MPTTTTKKKRRIRPVVEEVVETPPQAVSEPTVIRNSVALESPVVQAAETNLEVARYDEPPNIPQSKFEKGEGSNHKELNLKLIFLLTVLISLVVGFVSGGVYVYLAGTKEDTPQANVVQTPTPSSETEATPTPTAVATNVDVGDYRVRVLNGSGVIGAAGKVSASLEEAGFVVSSTGNAGAYNFTTTLIQAKESVPLPVIQKASQSLEDSYRVEVGDILPANSAWDIVVTAGRQ